MVSAIRLNAFPRAGECETRPWNLLVLVVVAPELTMQAGLNTVL